MDERNLAARMARLFEGPAPALRGGVEAEGELPHSAVSGTAISAWVETDSGGVRLELRTDGWLRVLAYDPASQDEALLLEQQIDVLVQKTLRQR